MSIEVENPTTVAEKVDAASNLVNQMMLAHMVRDEATFTEAHSRASELLQEAVDDLLAATEGQP